eukprot:10109043-Alexandrium_andersonii.AAC.1
MSASLVGSEMCIRDRCETRSNGVGGRSPVMSHPELGRSAPSSSRAASAVAGPAAGGTTPSA